MVATQQIIKLNTPSLKFPGPQYKYGKINGKFGTFRRSHWRKEKLKQIAKFRKQEEAGALNTATDPSAFQIFSEEPGAAMRSDEEAENSDYVSELSPSGTSRVETATSQTSSEKKRIRGVTAPGWLKGKEKYLYVFSQPITIRHPILACKIANDNRESVFKILTTKFNHRRLEWCRAAAIKQSLDLYDKQIMSAAVNGMDDEDLSPWDEEGEDEEEGSDFENLRSMS